MLINLPVRVQTIPEKNNINSTAAQGHTPSLARSAAARVWTVVKGCLSLMRKDFNCLCHISVDIVCHQRMLKRVSLRRVRKCTVTREQSMQKCCLPKSRRAQFTTSMMPHSAIVTSQYINRYGDVTWCIIHQENGSLKGDANWWITWRLSDNPTWAPLY